MLILVPTLLGPQNADPLAKPRLLLASEKTIEVQVSSRGASGTLVVAPDGSVLATTRTQTIVHNARGNLEFDREEQLYDALPPLGPLLGGAVGTDRLASEANALLVPFLIRRGKDPLLNRTYRREGANYVATVEALKVIVTFGKDRALSRIRYVTERGGADWTFKGLRAVPNNPSRFNVGIPAGYAEAYEPYAPDSLRIGSDLPNKFRSLAPEGAKPWLLAVLEPGTEPSDRAAEWLRRLGVKLPSSVLDGASAEDRRALAAPDSPTYILVGTGGKVLGVWIGHDPGEEARMEAEMTEAAESSSESSSE